MRYAPLCGPAGNGFAMQEDENDPCVHHAITARIAVCGSESVQLASSTPATMGLRPKCVITKRCAVANMKCNKKEHDLLHLDGPSPVSNCARLHLPSKATR